VLGPDGEPLTCDACPHRSPTESATSSSPPPSS
jgi:hypothetical protein